MTESEKQQWEQERAKGYNRYLLHTIVRKGLPFGITMTVFNTLWHNPVLTISEILIRFGALTLMFGFFMGLTTWYSKEEDYKEPTEDDDSAA